MCGELGILSGICWIFMIKGENFYINDMDKMVIKLM